MAQSHSLRTFASVLLATFALTTVSFCQNTQTAQTVKWDNYVFKFLPGGQMAQVMNSDGKIIGTILQMNGELKVIPLPGPEAEKLTKSFQDWKTYNARAHSGDSSAAATTTAGTTAPAIHFDEATNTITVPRPDGVTVTFVGEDVKIAGFQRGNYIVRHQKGGTGRFLERSVLHSSRAGGSLSGGGMEFLREGGGLIYDSGMGGNNLQENRQVLTAKQLSQVAVDAVADVRQVAGHESFTPPGYNTLKEISQYRLRSDGSR